VQSNEQTASVNARMYDAIVRTHNEPLTSKNFDAVTASGLQVGQSQETAAKDLEDWKEAVRQFFTTDGEIDGDLLYTSMTKLPPAVKENMTEVEKKTHDKVRDKLIKPLHRGQAETSDLKLKSEEPLATEFEKLYKMTPKKIGSVYGDNVKSTIEGHRKNVNQIVQMFIRGFKPEIEKPEPEVETKTMVEVALEYRDTITAFEVIPDNVDMMEVGDILEQLFLAVGGTPEEWAEADGSDPDEVESDDEVESEDE
jgi:restriction endonuclease